MAVAGLLAEPVRFTHYGLEEPPRHEALGGTAILLVFDPWRSAILLVAGDKSGQWDKWYRTAIPRAEQLYDDYLAERRKEIGT